jgi:hypothetical protein
MAPAVVRKAANEARLSRHLLVQGLRCPATLSKSRRMGSALEQGTDSRQRASAWYRRTAARIMAGLGVGTAALLSLAYASYMQAQPPEIVEAKPGQVVETGRWRIAISGARAVAANPDAVSRLEQSDNLQVDMQVTNLSRESSSAFARAAQLDPRPEGSEDPLFKLARDGAIAGNLHPGMPEHVTAYWPVSDVAQIQSVRFVVQGEIYKACDNLYCAPGWFPAGPVGTVTLSVTKGER